MSGSRQNKHHKHQKRQRYSDEGFSGTGVELSYLVPNPWDQYVLLTGEVADLARERLSPLRDLFAAVFFAGGSSSPVSSSFAGASPREPFAASTLRCSAASRST